MRYFGSSLIAILLSLRSPCQAAKRPSLSGPSYKAVHSRFSNSSLRVKSWPAEQTQLCPAAVAHHAGWADIDRYHEARHNPENAPLLVWLQGEPGLSSLHGMLYEHGPCLADDKGGTRDNALSWTEAFNVVYIDQLADVGFSYASDTDHGAYPSDSEGLSSDLINFLKIFYEAFPHLADNDLHIGGDSYAGHGISTFASTIIEYNDFLLSAPLGPLVNETIPLRSVILGNPLIDPSVQLPSLYDASCFDYRNFPPRVSGENCGKALTKLDACETALRTCSRNPQEPIFFDAAIQSCLEEFLEPLRAANTSTYDRRRIDCGSIDECHSDIDRPSAFLNSAEVLTDLLEVPSETEGKKKSWARISDPARKWHTLSGEGLISSTKQLGTILQAGRKSDMSRPATPGPIDLLVYSGVTDPMFNPDAIFEALRGIKWQGRAPFRAVPWEELPWAPSKGQKSGRVKAFSNLWMIELEEAGRMASYDQPESTLEMMKLWLLHLRGESVLGQQREKLADLGQKTLQVEEL
ncbi:Alpha/Beta hydrolase protein [Dactylonectria macrodidyma]|uniref:carboxypeptidase C n=1 Tax=Dactylonectria macrodidyma TaxID=307937 RepID=A0A9P9EMT5_9HYPO|nr:Alpha/Beta hydrolase protein [Dactylonectria macrodidyma]